jgi:hypothetical protein
MQGGRKWGAAAESCGGCGSAPRAQQQYRHHGYKTGSPRRKFDDGQRRQRGGIAAAGTVKKARTRLHDDSTVAPALRTAMRPQLVPRAAYNGYGGRGGGCVRYRMAIARRGRSVPENLLGSALHASEKSQ